MVSAAGPVRLLGRATCGRSPPGWGTPSQKKQAWVLVLSTILTLGMVSVFVMARRYYLVLTSQRLLFFGVRGQTTITPGALRRQIPRPGLTADRALLR